jgi:hypothetical protein
LALVRKRATRLLERWLLTEVPFPQAEVLDQVVAPLPPCCLAVLMLGQRIATAFGEACAALGERFRYDDALADNYRVVRILCVLPLLACVLTCAIAHQRLAERAWATDQDRSAGGSRPLRSGLHRRWC